MAGSGAGGGSAAAKGGTTSTSAAGRVGFSTGVGARNLAPERSRLVAIDGGGAGSGGVAVMVSSGCVATDTGLGAIFGAVSGTGIANARSATGWGAGLRGGLGPGPPRAIASQQCKA